MHVRSKSAVQLRAFALLLLLSSAAFAQQPPNIVNGPARPCPASSAGWTISYPAPSPITSVQYDQTYSYLSVIWHSSLPSVFVGVPLNVMQNFALPGINPVTVYNNSVFPYYHSLLLSQKNYCPLLFQDGSYIWSK